MSRLLSARAQHRMHRPRACMWLGSGLLFALVACDGDDAKTTKDLDATVADAGMTADSGPAEDAHSADPAPPDAALTYLPSESDFNGFHNWPSQAAIAPPNAPTGPHSLGNMTVYLNRRPAPGSKAFPPGTLIVKETDEADPTKRQTFGLAKRGGDYNANGAHGWEWFEFTNRADGTVFQKWRGLGPPPATGGDPADNCSGYGGDPAVCNGCHLAAAPNDYIWTTGLDLSKF
ncbi:MAG: hypothetical protein JWN04_2446 [Myxococcaceae bacterium]|nr:hypothetical protein [Myxococcaceae bacterium]